MGLCSNGLDVQNCHISSTSFFTYFRENRTEKSFSWTIFQLNAAQNLFDRDQKTFITFGNMGVEMAVFKQ